MVRDYKAFVIRVEEQRGDNFPLRAEFQGATWFANIPHTLPSLTKHEIEQAKEWLERGFIDRNYAKDFGRRLFDTLFSNDIKEGFRLAYERVAQEGGGLRVVLSLPQALADLPWELMYDEEGGHGFLARSTTSPLVRHYEVGTLSHTLPGQGPLRILLVTASPKDYPSTGGQDEIEEIRKNFAKRRVGIVKFLRLFLQHLSHTHSISDFIQRIRHRNLFEVDILPHATRTDLQNKIVEAQENGQGYHVVHFAGHGHVDENGSYLIFETDENKAELVEAEVFAEVLGEQSIILAVLNACQTASASNALRSVAQSTIQRGVPAVIGMQVPILDRTALGFAEEFYGAWASGQPIESALSYARRLIKEETPGAAADWGIPILFMKPVDGLKLNTASPPLQLPPMFRLLRWPIRVFLSLLATIGLLFTIPDVNQRLRTEVPIIRCIFPYPMESGFNVVVNEFTVVDKNGSMVSSQDGRAVADYIYDNLSYNFDEFNLGERYYIRPPEHTCLIKGDSRDEREVNAEALAERINADIVVYGVIRKGDGPALFSPEFYVNYKSFQEAGEITGQHEFGDSLSIPLPFDPLKINPSNNPALVARTQALSLVTVGLSYYSIDNYEVASRYFLQAKNIKGWANLPGKEIIYLLLGNTGNRRYSAGKSAEYAVRVSYLEEALSNYNEALGLNDNYARAMVGKAGALYLQALGNPADNDFANLDIAKLDEAVRLYNDALTLIIQPDTANIETKIHFGLGKIYLALYLREFVENRDSDMPLSIANSEFNAVLEAYNDGNGNVSITNLAGHSYAFLGVIARVQKKYDDAIDLTTRAIEIVSPYYKSYYNITLGNIYVEICNLELATEAYQEAIRIANFYGFADLITEASSKLEEVENIPCPPASG
jgi:tetratricopeptide (TPR) repeat protein